MKKLLLSLIGAAIAIIAHADVYDSGTITKVWDANKPTATLKNVDWTLDVVWTTDDSYYNNDGTKGFQLGSSKKYYSTATFSTEGISGTITSVKVNGSIASNGNCSISVKVGDAEFQHNNSTSVKLTTSATEYEFTGVGSGKVTITYTNSAKKATYLKQIQIEYTTVAKEQVTLSWSKESETIQLGGTFTAPELQVNPAEAAGAVVYDSSNPTLLQVADDGTMTLSPDIAGAATITASISKYDATYIAIPAKYTLTVKDPNAEEVTIVFSEEGLDNGVELTSFTKAPVTFTFAQEGASFPPKYYVSDRTARMYINNTLTISIEEGFYITSIKAEGTSLGDITCNSGSYENGVWIATSNESSSVVFTATASMKFTQITVECRRKPVKAEAGLAFLQSEFTIVEGEEFSAPTLSNDNGLTVTYSSTVEDVAMVDETTGEVVVMGVGTTVITAKSAETDKFKAGEASYTLTVVAKPAAPTLTIDGNEINLDESYNLNRQSKDVTITAAEGNHIYHKFTVDASTPSVAVLAETTADGFTRVESNTATLTISENGTLEFYAEDPATGARSDVKALTFNGGAAGISEVEAAGSEAARWYDLQGRRVAAPAKGNLYIIKQGSKTSKRAL